MPDDDGVYTTAKQYSADAWAQCLTELILQVQGRLLQQQ